MWYLSYSFRLSSQCVYVSARQRQNRASIYFTRLWKINRGTLVYNLKFFEILGGGIFDVRDPDWIIQLTPDREQCRAKSLTEGAGC